MKYACVLMMRETGHVLCFGPFATKDEARRWMSGRIRCPIPDGDMPGATNENGDIISISPLMVPEQSEAMTDVENQ